MAGLTDFLLARIAEDERIALLFATDSPTDETEFTMWTTAFSLEPDRLIVAVDYQRSFVDCAAKRRIVEGYLEVSDHDSSMYLAADDRMETAVRELATTCADHDNYRSEWRD